MTYELHLRHYDRAGTLKNAYVNPVWARFTDAVNEARPLVFRLHSDEAEALDFAEFDFFRVMLRNKELGIYAGDGEFVPAYTAILRDWEISTDNDAQTYYDFTCPGANHILSWRAVLWYAGTNNRSSFSAVAAETVMKTLVQYNCTSEASEVNGRQRDGDLLVGMGFDIQIASDQGRGETLSGAMMGDNLLSALQEIAEQAGGDFALTWLAANQWQFEFYDGQLGADKSSGAGRVLFTLQNQTMRKPRLQRTGAGATAAVSAGQGQGDAREISTVTWDDYASDADLEMFVDARSESDANGRVYRAGQRLEANKVQRKLSFDVLQTSNQFYSPVDVPGRLAYRAGDLVLASYGGVEEIRKIESVTVNWKAPQGGDALLVDVELSEAI